MEAEVRRGGPFLGLTTYKAQDRQYFAGREAEIETIGSNLRANRLTILYGPSGVGKSSLINAGLVPELEKQGLTRSGRTRFIVVSLDTWFGDPIRVLTDAVRLRLPAGIPQVEESLEREQLSEKLSAWTTELDADIYLILDQFEQFLTRTWGQQENNPFVKELATIVNAPNLRVNCLISIRDDALWRLDALKGGIPSLFRNYLRLGHLKTDKAKDVIERPLGAYNESVSEAERVTLEPGFTDAVISKVEAIEAVTDGNEAFVEEQETVPAAYLQVVMEKIWAETAQSPQRVLRLDALEKIGKWDDIVYAYLRSATDRLTNRECGLLADILDVLISPDDKRNALTAKQITERIKITEDDAAELFSRLASPPFRIINTITPDVKADEGQARFELAHDLLIPPAIRWRREVRKRRIIKKITFKAAAASCSAIAVILAVVAFVGTQQENQNARQKTINDYRTKIGRQVGKDPLPPPNARTAIMEIVDELGYIDSLGSGRRRYKDEYATSEGYLETALQEVPSILSWVPPKANWKDTAAPVGLCFSSDAASVAVSVEGLPARSFAVTRNKDEDWNDPKAWSTDAENNTPESQTPNNSSNESMSKGPPKASGPGEDLFDIAHPDPGVSIIAKVTKEGITLDRRPDPFPKKSPLPNPLVELSSVAISGDGSVVAAGGRYPSGGEYAVAVWAISDAGTTGEPKLIQTFERARQIALSGTGTYLELLFRLGRLEVRDLRNLDRDPFVVNVDFRPDHIAVGERSPLVAIARDWTVYIYEADRIAPHGGKRATSPEERRNIPFDKPRWTIPFESKIRAISIGEMDQTTYIGALLEDGYIFISDLFDPKKPKNQRIEETGAEIRKVTKNKGGNEEGNQQGGILEAPSTAAAANPRREALRRFTRKPTEEAWEWLTAQ